MEYFSFKDLSAKLNQYAAGLQKKLCVKVFATCGERKTNYKSRDTRKIQHSIFEAIAQDVAKGASVSDASKAHGVSRQSFYRWMRRNA